LNNIESQIESLANDREPYVGMPLAGLTRGWDHGCCKPDHHDHDHCLPDHHDHEHCIPDHHDHDHDHRMPDHHDRMPMHGDPLAGLPLAMAYVPWQCWGETYKPAEALCRGTIFPELDLPFLGGEY